MSQLNISTLANLAGSETTPIADVVNGSARAWVNFNGTGTVAIRGSYNVSSITDISTGNYTIHFTNPMPDTNFVASLSVKMSSQSLGYAQTICSEYRFANSRSVNYIRVNATAETSATLNSAYDPEAYQVTIHR